MPILEWLLLPTSTCFWGGMGWDEMGVAAPSPSRFLFLSLLLFGGWLRGSVGVSFLVLTLFRG